MNSRITIDVNENNQPVIKIQYKDSTDVRDKLVKIFLESFGYQSNWATHHYIGVSDGEGTTSTITPIPSSTRILEEESSIMASQVEVAKKFENKY